MEYKSKLVQELISILTYLAKQELNKAINFVKTYDTSITNFINNDQLRQDNVVNSRIYELSRKHTSDLTTLNNNNNNISCNAIFPSMNKNITNFINTNKYQYYLYNTQVENSNIKYYQNVYSNYLIFRGDNVQHPQYLDIE